MMMKLACEASLCVAKQALGRVSSPLRVMSRCPASGQLVERDSRRVSSPGQVGVPRPCELALALAVARRTQHRDGGLVIQGRLSKIGGPRSMAGQGPSHVTQGGTSGCWVGGGSELALALRCRRLRPGETVEMMADGQKSPPCSPAGITRRPRELARCGCPVIRLMMGGRAPIREHPSWSCERTPRHHPTLEPWLSGMRGHLRRCPAAAARPAPLRAAEPVGPRPGPSAALFFLRLHWL